MGKLDSYLQELYINYSYSLEDLCLWYLAKEYELTKNYYEDQNPQQLNDLLKTPHLIHTLRYRNRESLNEFHYEKIFTNKLQDTFLCIANTKDCYLIRTQPTEREQNYIDQNQEEFLKNGCIIPDYNTLIYQGDSNNKCFSATIIGRECIPIAKALLDIESI